MPCYVQPQAVLLRHTEYQIQLAKQPKRSPYGAITPTNVFGCVPHDCVMEELQPS